jgi:mono/diheme cytochrome c family protein
MTPRFAVSLLAVAALAGADGAAAQPTAQPTPRSVRMTMQALHEAGGVPPGWELTLQPGDPIGGRQLFFEQGCHKCHVVQGANLPAVPDGEAGVGPELTGMGRHHPPAYFLESILNPNAVLIEGPGYIDVKGRSTMPIYPELTVVQLQDLVAFLASLTSGDAACHDAAPTPAPGTPAAPAPALAAPPPQGPLPSPPPARGGVYLVQSYEVRADQLAAFEAWFRDELTPKMRAFPGVVGVETVVDRTNLRQPVTTVFAFRDRAAYDRWNNNLAMRELAARFDDFVGLHGHIVYGEVPIYPAPSLSFGGGAGEQGPAGTDAN